MEPFYSESRFSLYLGDCVDVLRCLPDSSVDSVVTDPPYGISFLGSKWDYEVPTVAVWEECLRVLKPGGHLLAFAGTRTQHRMAVNIEDAGFTIRDMIAWVYGSGFPHSKNLEGEWDGWGTSLKPATEPVTWATKPLTIVPFCDLVKAEQLIGLLICLSLSSAKHATSLLTSSQHGLNEASASARLIAEAYPILSSNAESVKTGMFKSLEAERTILCIVESWRIILAAVSESPSTFTTSTATKLTTELRIFNSLILENTLDYITREETEVSGMPSSASIAENLLIALSDTSKSETFAQELVTLLMELNHASSVGESFMPAAKLGSSVLLSATTSLEEKIRPALEPITVARKPFAGSVEANMQSYGTGGINIDACRIPVSETDENRRPNGSVSFEDAKSGMFGVGGRNPELGGDVLDVGKGRWPANFIHDGGDEVVSLMPESGSNWRASKGQGDGAGMFGVSGGGTQGQNDSGSAARFFKCCERDCPSCLTCAKDSDTVVLNHKERIELWKRIAVHNAENNGKTSKATSEFIARTLAIGKQNENLVLNVKSAGSLCDLCATSIAVALVGIKTSAFSSAELQAILACTTNCNAYTLIRSLASFAELWENTDTIPTTNSLSLLFGSVRDAISNSTRQDTRAKAEPRFALNRFAYHSKASKADRDEGCEGLEYALNPDCPDSVKLEIKQLFASMR